MRLVYAVLFGCAPSLLSAQALVDPEAVLQKYSELVVTTTIDGVLNRTLDLPPGSHIECVGPVGAAECVGMDTSEFGAVGCIFMIANEVRHSLMACPKQMTEDEFTKIDDITMRLADFMATNAVPPLGSSDVESLLRQSGLPDNLDCPKIDNNPESAMFVDFGRHLIDEVAQKGFDGFVGPARLPMMNPCL
jgi:hypothetical protein